MVREKKRILIVLACLLVIIPFFLVSGTFNGRKGSQIVAYTVHEPIEISSDTELAINAVMGSGNETDPFILEGWQINAKGV